MEHPLTQYLPIAIVFGLAGAMAFIIPIFAGLLGPKSSTKVKNESF